MKENLSIFWPAAHAGYTEVGRGAIVIDGYSEPLGEDTQFHYASLAEFEEQEDRVSNRMAELVSEYDPEQQFVAVIIRQPEVEYEFSMSLTNLDLDPEIETVFLMANVEYSHISSTLIRQIASLQGELRKLVPPEIEMALQARARERNGG